MRRRDRRSPRAAAALQRCAATRNPPDLRRLDPIADRAARQLGIPVDRAWTSQSWVESAILNRELEPKPELRRRASDDPVIGPRLGGYHRVYYRRGLEKFPPYGSVTVDPRTGDVLGVRVRLRPEEAGTQPTEQQLRARADSFVHSRNFPGAVADIRVRETD